MWSLSRDVRRGWFLSPREFRLLAEAVVWLGLLRAATLALPYRRVASLLRLTPPGACGSPPDRLPASTVPQVEAIGWAVAAAAARTPWHSTCLVQSLAGCAILRRRGLPSAVYLGVAKDATGGFTAHSWLRCGDAIVTGRGGSQRYSAIAASRSVAGNCR